MKDFLDKIKNKISEAINSLKGIKVKLSNSTKSLGKLKDKIVPFLFSGIDNVTGFMNERFKTRIPKLSVSKGDREKEELDELIKLSGVSGVSSDSFKKENLSNEDRIAIDKAREEEFKAFNTADI